MTLEQIFLQLWKEGKIKYDDLPKEVKMEIAVKIMNGEI